MPKLYFIENKLNGHGYVGYTSQTLETRLIQHISHANSSTRKHHPLYDAIKSYGRDNFKISLLYEGNDALEREDEYIQLMGYYNLCPGGSKPPKYDWTGKKHKPESINKMRAARLGKKFGPLSEIHREAIRQGNKGKQHSQQQISKYIETRKRNGKTKGLNNPMANPEFRAKVGASKIGRKKVWIHGEAKMINLQKLDLEC